MRALRRNDYTPRVELTPLIDVVLLLLTFFIYNVAMMVRAQVMPVALTPLGDASLPGQSQRGQIDAITVTRQGQVFYNRQAVTADQFKARLADLAKTPAAQRPKLFLAMEARGDVDRGPLFIGLIEQIRAAGINDFAIVGQPQPAAAQTSQDRQGSPSPAGDPARVGP